MTVIVSSKTQGSKKIGNASRSALVNFKGQNHFWMSISKWSEKSFSGIFHILYNSFEYVSQYFSCYLRYQIDFVQTQKRLMMNWWCLLWNESIHTYVPIFLCMKANTKITIKITMSSHMSPYHKLYYTIVKVPSRCPALCGGGTLATPADAILCCIRNT